ncbi:MAG: membrane protein insertase YidC [Candidatus Omnitrophica bacterium]|nr:membrane protein insertase YidC [Candidatus Omnitrophota bacterium]
MNKRAALAFFLSLLVIISYNYFMAQKYPPAEITEEVISGQAEQKGPTFSSPVLQTQPEAERQGPFVAQTQEQAKEITVETDLVKVAITSSGARIKSCRLKKHAEEKLKVYVTEARINEIEQILTRATPQARELLQREKDKLKILLRKIKENAEMAELVSLAATADTDFAPTIIIPDDQDKSLALNRALYQCSRETLILSEGQPEGRLEFTYSDNQGRRIKKVYTFSNSNYGIGLDITFLGWEREDFPAGHFLLYCGPDVGLPQAQSGRRTYGYQGPITYFLNAQQSQVQREKYMRKENNVFVRREHPGRIGWTGLENKYFLAALIPGQAAESAIIEKNKFGEQRVALKVPWQGSGVYNFKVYLGPKKEERLKEIGATLEKSIDYGIFSAIARLIYQILLFFSRWTRNFGWAIVLLCFVVKIVFYPLTHRSFEGMQKMQQQMKTLQPEMDALRAKYKDNPQKLNKEIMELYRKRGVNPMASCQSGCLPLLLQMPVFFALYAVLYNSIELRGTPFFGWIEDLSAKDPYYVLPILMGISMFVQQKLTGMGAAGGAQQEQAKMMTWLMPIFLTWIFASLPSGVVLYWLTFNILTALQQLLIKKKQTPLEIEHHRN